MRCAPLVNFEKGVHTFQTPPQVDRAPPGEDFDEVPAEVAAQIAYLVRAELDKATAEGSLRPGGGVPKAAAFPQAPPPEVLEIQDESSDEEERAPRHVAKAKRHGKAKQAA